MNNNRNINPRSGDWLSSIGDYLHLLIINIKQMVPVTIVPRCILSAFLRSSLIIFTLLLIPSLGHAAWFDNDWQYRKQVTIDDAMVPNNDQTNIPVLIYRATDNDLRDNAQSDGSDIVFTSSDETTQLSHEIEFYDNTNGNLVAWVKVPTLNSSGGSATDTILYMYYGDTDHATNGDQEDSDNTWDAAYVGVYHLDEDMAGVGTNDFYIDSSGTGNHGDDQVSATGKTGRIGRGQDFNNGGLNDDRVGITDSASIGMDGAANITLSAWIYPRSYGQSVNGRIIDKGGGSSLLSGYTFAVDDDGGSNASDGLRLDINGGAGNARATSNDSVINLNEWQYVVAVYDDAANTGTIYVNGVDQTNDNSIDRGVIGGNAVEASIGGRYDDAREFDGLIDEVRVQNVGRDADWILTQYRNQSDYFAGVPMDYVTFGVETLGAISSTTALVDSSGSDSSAYTIGSSTTGSIYVSVNDSDENANAGSVETVSITISSNLTGDSETITLTETGVNTGIFNNLSTGLSLEADNTSFTNNSILETRANATITASYTDNDDGSDTSSDQATIEDIRGTFSISLDMTEGSAKRGDILQGTLSITNMKSSIIQDTDIVLGLPLGITYLEGSANVLNGGVSISSITQNNRDTLFTIPTIGANSECDVSFKVIVGSNAKENQRLNITVHTDNG